MEKIAKEIEYVKSQIQSYKNSKAGVPEYFEGKLMGLELALSMLYPAKAA